MKRHFVVLLVALTISTVAAVSFSKTINNLEKVSDKAFKVAKNEQNYINQPLSQDVSGRGWILNKEAKKALENIILQLPCGWPEYGIPPLAPYTKEGLIIDFKKSFIDTLTKLFHLRVDGLDIILINELKISYIFGKKIKYSITLPKIIITAQIDTELWLNLMPEYGVSIRYDGKGKLEVMLEDITIKGSFKYKVPIIFGSVKIYDFISVISLGNVVSEIKLIGAVKKLNQLLNDKIEYYLLKAVNNNQKKISDTIEETVVPLVNAKMKGHTIWYLISKIGGINRVCYPGPIPWDPSDNNVL